MADVTIVLDMSISSAGTGPLHVFAGTSMPCCLEHHDETHCDLQFHVGLPWLELVIHPAGSDFFADRGRHGSL